VTGRRMRTTLGGGLAVGRDPAEARERRRAFTEAVRALQKAVRADDPRAPSLVKTARQARLEALDPGDHDEIRRWIDMKDEEVVRVCTMMRT